MGNMFNTIEIKDGVITVLDQTRLPREEVYLEARTTEDVWDYIKRLVVRGATLIGVTAGYGMWLAMKEVLSGAQENRELEAEEIMVIDMAFREKAKYLDSARPTAVNLSYAVKRMLGRWERIMDSLVSDDPSCAVPYITPLEILDALFEEAQAIRDEDEYSSKKKGEYGMEILKPGMTILTHCNAGALASVGCGGILASVYMANEQGYGIKVYADETRPLLQGARLTAWELHKNNVDATLICDNMASTVMKQGKIDAVIVGCDRMAANGDAANKIGTSGVAILAKEYGIPFYFSLPTSTIDMKTATGDDIEIEERDPEEVTEKWYAERMAPEGINVYNPAFDVTDHKYITGIITEKGIVYPPYDVNLPKIMGEEE